MSWLSALLLSVAVLLVAMTCVAYLTWLERKVAARFQNRIGPYWVGYPHGWLQPLADVAKLIIKEDITPRHADRILFGLAPILMLVPALLGFAFLPFADGWAVVEAEQDPAKANPIEYARIGHRCLTRAFAAAGIDVAARQPLGSEAG